MSKVQELADKAKKSVPHGLTPDKWIEVYNTKFAELIEQDVIERLKNKTNHCYTDIVSDGGLDPRS